MGPTPLATDSDQIISATMAKPHATDDTKNGFLNFSGRMNKNGTDIHQNTMNPISSYVVVGVLALSVFGMFAKEGQMAVMHTLCLSAEMLKKLGSSFVILPCKLAAIPA